MSYSDEKPNKDLETFKDLLFDFDNLITKIREKIPEQHDPIKIVAIQRIKEGYFWIKELFEIIEITKVKGKSQHGTIITDATRHDS